MDLLSKSHPVSLVVAIALVFLASVLTFRSVLSAIVVLLPVATGVLSTYAVMGVLNIDIAPCNVDDGGNRHRPWR